MTDHGTAAWFVLNAVLALSSAVESVRPLVSVLEQPVRVESSTMDSRLLDQVTDRVGLDRIGTVEPHLDIGALIDRSCQPFARSGARPDRGHGSRDS